ncbi:hypothetical protein NDU88_005307 [Pleurodeles waltl]|uniref:Uncharacterized protein n=1 Tax=Pleurodeles waltl TaxID=8319 RepID=A0AAV7LX05_PLEWA|nr:hypothetical protein NDU88_005307 [Pleurodeles waltl]
MTHCWPVVDPLPVTLLLLLGRDARAVSRSNEDLTVFVLFYKTQIATSEDATEGAKDTMDVVSAAAAALPIQCYTVDEACATYYGFGGLGGTDMTATRVELETTRGDRPRRQLDRSLLSNQDWFIEMRQFIQNYLCLKKDTESLFSVWEDLMASTRGQIIAYKAQQKCIEIKYLSLNRQ